MQNGNHAKASKGEKMNTQKRLYKPTVRKSVNNEPAYFKAWNKWSKGDTLIAQFDSRFEGREYKGKKPTNARVKVLECNFKVESTDAKGKVTVVDPTDKMLILNDLTIVNNFLDDVQTGWIIELVYDGKQKGSDGTEYHSFSVMEAGPAVEETEADEAQDDEDMPEGF